jgi:hypothetical protein
MNVRENVLRERVRELSADPKRPLWAKGKGGRRSMSRARNAERDTGTRIVQMTTNAQSDAFAARTRDVQPSPA